MCKLYRIITLFEAGVSGPRDSSREFLQRAIEERTVEIEFNSEGVPKQLPRRSPFAFPRFARKPPERRQAQRSKHFEVRIKGTPNELEADCA